jgi:hypothetical protein
VNMQIELNPILTSVVGPYFHLRTN